MFELMRGLPIFKGFADDDLARLASQVHNRQLAAGEVLFRQGEAGHACYVVLDGELEVIGHPGQTEVRLEICRPGRMIGEMALIDPSPRSATVRAVTASHLAVFEGKIEEELAVARRIQELFLPRSLPQPPGWQIAAFNRGAQEIGGDFFDCIELADGTLGVVVADVCGKGVPAALFVALTRSLVRASSLAPWALQRGGEQGSDQLMAGALWFANDYIASEHGASTMFITLFYGMLEPTTGRLGYINAGHNPPLIISADGQSVRELESSALPLGIVPGQTYETNALILAPGELLVGFSDGITEAMNQSGEPYGDRRLTQALQAHAGQPAQTLVRTITQRVDEFVAGAPQADDMTMLVIKRSV